MKWISVKKEMPEADTKILYVVKDRGSDLPWVATGMRCWDGNYWWWCDMDGEMGPDGNEPGFSTVTHWMPFPEPPK